MDEKEFRFDWDDAKAASNFENTVSLSNLHRRSSATPGVLHLPIRPKVIRRTLVFGGTGKYRRIDVGSLPWPVAGGRWPSSLDSNHYRSTRHGDRDSVLHGKPMTNQPIDEEILAEIDFSKATRGSHRIPTHAPVFLPASIERRVWEYFSDRAAR